MIPEFSRPIAIDTISDAPRTIAVSASADERRRLAGRFRLKAIDSLAATIAVSRRAGMIHAEGRVAADVVQSCVVTDEPLPAHIDAPVAVRFVPEAYASASDEEIELSSEDCDTLPIEDGRIDLGELAAETLALALDPYPRSPNAELYSALATDGVEGGPFAALQQLKERLGKKD